MDYTNNHSPYSRLASQDEIRESLHRVDFTEKNTFYAFSLSYSNWGRLMAEAFEPGNKEESAFLKWAGERPEGEASWVNPDMV